jgi:hypothetical protein
MATQDITNPLGAHQTVTDFTTGVDRDGQLIHYSFNSVPIRANAAIGKGEVLSWVAPTTTVPLSVTPMAAATVGSLFAGVAAKAAAAGAVVEVILPHSVALVDCGASTIAAGTVIVKPTTTGKALNSAALDATTIAGTVIGVALGAKNASNQALCWLYRS